MALFRGSLFCIPHGSHRPSCGWKIPDGWKFIQMHENRWGRLPRETGIPHSRIAALPPPSVRPSASHCHHGGPRGTARGASVPKGLRDEACRHFPSFNLVVVKVQSVHLSDHLVHLVLLLPPVRHLWRPVHPAKHFPIWIKLKICKGAKGAGSVLVLHGVSKGTFINVPLLVDARRTPIFGVFSITV